MPDTIATLNTVNVLTSDGVSELTRAIFNNVNTRIQERIVNSVADDTDVAHVPNVSTVNKAIAERSKIKNLTIADGDITKATITPDPNTVYLVRKTATDTKATMFIWIDPIGYINCGGSDDAVEFVINEITNDAIAQIVAQTYTETNPGIAGTP